MTIPFSCNLDSSITLYLYTSTTFENRYLGRYSRRFTMSINLLVFGKYPYFGPIFDSILPQVFELKDVSTSGTNYHHLQTNYELSWGMQWHGFRVTARYYIQQLRASVSRI